MGCERRPWRKAGLDAVGHATGVSIDLTQRATGAHPAAGLGDMTCVCDMVRFMILKDYYWEFARQMGVRCKKQIV